MPGTLEDEETSEASTTETKNEGSSTETTNEASQAQGEGTSP
jgi:hypothetical protein